MYTSFLLTLPLLAPVLGHTIPRSNHGHAARANAQMDLDARALRDAAAAMAIAGKRAIPKAHFGFPPSTQDAEGMFHKRDGELSERGVPKAHLGFPPSANDLEAAAGFSKRDNQVLVRRRKNKSKRACTVKQAPAGVPTTPASSSIGGGLAAQPTSSSSHAVVTPSSSVYVAPSSSSGAWVEASSTSSASAEPSGGALSGLMAYVFPQGRGTADWTTVVDEAGSMSFNAALNPLTAGKLPSSGSAPDGSNALVASYPAGTVKLASGQGYSFYTSGDHGDISIQGAKEVVFSYSVFFQDGFQFVKGGKLPGLYGGTSAETAKSCSGGRQDARDECFSARLMWRANGAGEIYNYLPSAAYNNGNYCNTPPYSKCDPNYGESIGRGAFTFPTGQWTTVAIRLKMNDANVANGEQELFVNGASVIKLTDLMISVNSETKIYGIMAQTFFGGSDDTWASPIDQSAWFKDWSLAVLA